MPLNEVAFIEKYDIAKLSIRGSTQISKKTAVIIAKLNLTSQDGKPVMVILTASSRAATKLISIVEIAKRELAATGVKCYQYNALSSEMITIERNTKKTNGNDDQGGMEEVGYESDDAFETMGAEVDLGPKKREVPVMTTYLSSTPVKGLKMEYGEQTS